MPTLPVQPFKPMTFTRRHHAVTALHAVENSPTLARLAQLTRDSSNRLTAILPLVPPLLRASLQEGPIRSEEHTSELQSQSNLVCRLLLEKKKKKIHNRSNENT